MNYKKYTTLFSLILLGMGLSCTTDESLFPLPYYNRATGAYVRMYLTTSSSFDINDLANSGFEAIYEPVDEKNGDNLASIEFYATLKRGTAITPEVLIKTVDNTGFVAPPAPTYSAYKRQKIRITANETLAALLTSTAAIPSCYVGTPLVLTPGCWPDKTNDFKSLAGYIAPPASYVVADQIIYRWVLVLKDGRRISVANPHNNNDAAEIGQNSADLATGLFYLSPFQKTVVVRTLLPNSWVGTYGLKQMAIWSPNHSAALHATAGAFPKYMNTVLFPNQTVTLAKPAGGLSSEREFTVTYRTGTSTMRINLEEGVPGTTGAGLTGTAGTAALATMNAASSTVAPFGLGFTGATNANLGTVFVPLQNSNLSCTSKRQLYWVTSGSGTFAGTTAMPVGLPLGTTPNRGLYRTNILGTTPGDVFSISVDDDCDEYGRGSGYCTWTRRVIVTLTKQ